MIRDTFTADRVTERLGRTVRGEVLRPGDDGYDTARALALPVVDPRPLAVVRPVDAQDVAAALAVLVGEGAPFALRGGGHHPSAWAGGDGAFVLDMRAMDAIEVDPDGRAATAQAGVTTGEYTRRVGERGLATTFGDTPTVGVVGLTLGGGLGFLSRAHGLTVDNLLGAEVVTAGGEVVWADAESHPDLFWALRGGGGGLGVVTRLRFALREVPSVYGGFLMLPGTPETVHGVVQAALDAPDELTVIVQTMRAPPLPSFPPELHGQPIVAVRGAYLGDADAGAAAFAPMRALGTPLLDALQPMPYAAMLDEPPGPPMKVRFTTAFRDGWDLAAAERVVALATAPARGLRGVQLRPLGGAIARVAADATAFPHRQRRLFVGAMAGPAGDEDLPAALDWLGEARSALGEGAAAFFSFLDAGGAGLRDAYPGGTWERLQAVKRAYDPHGAFGPHRGAPPA